MFLSPKIINRKNFLLLLFLWLLSMAVFQYIFYELKKACGTSTILDLYFHYDMESVRALFSQYGPAGRKIYLYVLLLDMIYPLLYTLLFWMSLTYLSQRIHLPNLLIKVFQTLPWIAMTFDYLENGFEFWMTLGFPTALSKAAPIGGWFTTLKWISIYTNFVLLILLLIIFVFGMNLRED